jgi:hypothetical protein
MGPWQSGDEGKEKAAYYVYPSIDLRKASFADVLQPLELPDDLFRHI